MLLFWLCEKTTTAVYILIFHSDTRPCTCEHVAYKFIQFFILAHTLKCENADRHKDTQIGTSRNSRHTDTKNILYPGCHTFQWQFCHHPLLHCPMPGKALWPGLHPRLWFAPRCWVHESCSLYQSCGTAWWQSRCICDTREKDIISVILALF